MIANEQVEQLLAEQPEYQVAFENLLPVPLIEPSDISEAMVYLCGHSGRYITGITLPVMPDLPSSKRFWGTRHSLGGELIHA